MKTPIITIVGKPNVGKSTLFNKIVGARIAIEDPTAGTTRDRIFHKVSHKEIDFFLVDTGGLEFEKPNSTIEDDMRSQAEIAIEQSDLILFVVNSQHDLSADDYKVAELLRRKENNKPVFLIANKCDHPLNPEDLAEFYQLGLNEPIQISALHKTGVDMLIDQIIKSLKDQSFITKNSKQYREALKFDQSYPNIALVGRPNVGKSSLINALLKKDKVIVSDIPGTTRDATDTLVKAAGKEYNFIDTAGLRRKGKIEKGIEKFSALRTLSAIARSDIALLVIDASSPIAHQDQQVASYILEAEKGLIIVVNKWDINPDEDEEIKRRKKMMARLQHRFPFLSWAPVVFTSAVTKKNLNQIFPQIEGIREEQKKRIQTAKLNQFVLQAVENHKPTGTKMRYTPKVLYATQVGVEPPHIVIFVNKKAAFHFSYIRYLENKLREKFSFTGTPLKLEYRERKED